jgi:hypothetical protein
MTFEELAKRITGSKSSWLNKVITEALEAAVNATRDHVSAYPIARACKLGPKCRADIAQRAAKILEEKKNAN